MNITKRSTKGDSIYHQSKKKKKGGKGGRNEYNIYHNYILRFLLFTLSLWNLHIEPARGMTVTAREEGTKD